ncbi:hypothetical protein [Rhodalgimonas zhirmunskyi]|uniref:Uncharacterized protein n=1 Tax=Rhodalgimonas zhirmunskyi TaxID=2964767 RepID=A0AAJ1X5P5_9RHOB|nr:hypothetical protein [Rhodoalgimonas zhirmunskyi]MDQ2093819.1 hypothetical protein [Rhodoalgimonas zhirmunskyi]
MIRLTVAALGLALLAGCSDPLKTVPRLGDVDVAGSEPMVEAVAAPVETDPDTGFMARLLRKREVGPSSPADSVAVDTAPDVTAQTPVVVPDTQTAPQATAQKRGGFLGLFSRDKAQAVTGAQDGEVVQASLSKPAIAAESIAEPRAEPKADPRAEPRGEPRGGLFSRSKAARVTGPDARMAAPGEVLPFGTVARACHLGRGDLGREVAQYPEKRAKYRIYDSAPGNQALHNFYITGFDDGCPRQVTAALVVFGSASMYEALRYGLPENARSKRPTDAAYEKLKSGVCKVGRKKPCGNKIGQMEKTAVFLSVYNRFEGADGWSNLLVADGAVLAMDQGG